MKRRKPKNKLQIKKVSQKKLERLKKTHLYKEKLGEYKKILILRKRSLLGSFSQMEDEALAKSRREASGDLSNAPLHIADLGSDTYEQEFTLGLIENEGVEIQEINAALERIENRTYGICEQCNKPISGNRLKVIPYTRLCIKCKEKEESGHK